jgi:hypothetical protein
MKNVAGPLIRLFLSEEPVLENQSFKVMVVLFCPPACAPIRLSWSRLSFAYDVHK